jgi:glycerol kinase
MDCLVFAASALPALAHEEGPPDPHVAESVAPGLTALGLLVLAAAATALWIHLRKLAMIRALRQEIEASAHQSTSASSAQDEQSSAAP